MPSNIYRIYSCVSLQTSYVQTFFGCHTPRYHMIITLLAAKDVYLPEDREAGRQMELQLVRRARQELDREVDPLAVDHWGYRYQPQLRSIKNLHKGI